MGSNPTLSASSQKLVPPRTFLLGRGDPLIEAGGYRVAEKLLSLKRRPSAVVLVHEMMAIGFYQRTAEAGVRIGKDMAVIGFRDSPRCDHLSPSLTRFRPKIRDLGLRLGEVLLGEMAGRKKHGRPVCEIWPMELVPGDSG